ncbi:MAG: undecaprenyl-diphosphatase UppP [Thermoanaerobaculia bacterium]
MIDWFQALVLGIVQGATEYLPISSSGHLVIAQHLFGLEEPALFFDIVLHLGTLVAVIWYYRKDIVKLVAETFAGLRNLALGHSWKETLKSYPGFRFALLIVVGTIPTAVIGLAFEDTFERLFGSVRLVGLMLIVTGTVLLLTRLARSGGRDAAEMTWVDALTIGVVQGLAITPGISRSGITIAAALLLGIDRETAARYSFLLSIPSILGALLLRIGGAHDGVGTTALVVGFTAAALTGYFCLALLVRLVKKGRLSWFAPYCFALGLLALVLG